MYFHTSLQKKKTPRNNTKLRKFDATVLCNSITGVEISLFGLTKRLFQNTQQNFMHVEYH
jgi:hypothetical protein